MLNRHLAVGLLLGATAVALAVTVRFGNQSDAAPLAERAATDTSGEDGFVELRFRLPRSTALPTTMVLGKQGTMVNTGRPLDVAIEGVGFFQVTMPNGELRYTRRGLFTLNAAGNLVTADGFLVSPHITVPLDAVSVSIGSDGTVSVVRAGSTNVSTVLGQLLLVRFVNPDGLAKEHDRLLAETASSGIPCLATPGQNGFGLVRQGYQEQHRDEMLRTVVSLLAQLAEEEGTPRVKVQQVR